MNTLSNNFFILLYFIFLFNTAYSQINNSSSELSCSIPSLAILNIESQNSVSFNSPSDASIRLSPESSGSCWINYSSIIAAGTTNKITVNISSGTVPESTSIKLIAGSDVGNGAGNVGMPTNEITVTENPKSIITNIGSCYTGKGLNNGHPINYAWVSSKESANSELLASNSVALTFTILSSE